MSKIYAVAWQVPGVGFDYNMWNSTKNGVFRQFEDELFFQG